MLATYTQHMHKIRIAGSPCRPHLYNVNCPKPKSSCPESLQARNSKLKNNQAFNVFNHIITLANCFWLKPKIKFVKTNEMAVESHDEVKWDI